MNQRVEYKMMGVAPGALEDMREERYKVAVLTIENGNVIEEQSLLLPLAAARLLCASMATDDTLPSLLVRDSASPWYPDTYNAALPGLAQVIARTARRMTAWTRHSSLKYINIRVDMRGGGFILTDYDGNEAADKILTMLKIPPYN